MSKKSNLVKKARIFATRAHEGQVRKYTGAPYIEHPIHVASIVAFVPHTLAMLAAALLHDVLEDTKVTEADLRAEFGNKITRIVVGLTNISRPEDGNRAVRKTLDLLHLKAQDADVQTIKIADLISNTESIVKHDPEFAEVYLREKRELLDVLTKGNRTLHKIAERQCAKILK